jgi:hypothetical protein
MTDVADPTMSYEGLVEAGRAAREQADNMQWVEGDLALQVEALPATERPRDPETGEFLADEEKALKRYADDVDVNYSTLKGYRTTAERWPRDRRLSGVGFEIHRMLNAQDDRFDLIHEAMTWRAAQKLVRDRTAGNTGKPGWLELMGMAADKMLAAGKDLAKVEADLDAKGLDEVTPKMVEKAAGYRAIAEDLAARFGAIEAA